MRESHACGSKITITRTGQFLTPNWQMRIVAHKPIKWKLNNQFWRKMLQQMSLSIIRLCHSYLSTRHVLRTGSEVRKNLREYLKAVVNLWSSSEVIGKVFGNHPKASESLRKIGLCETRMSFHVHEILKIEATSVDVYFFRTSVTQVYRR